MSGSRDSKFGSEPEHRFGGDWTRAKLRVLKGYLEAYTTALKNQPFRKGFIDAFAGTGYRMERSSAESLEPDTLLFPDLAQKPTQRLLEGSARVALRAEPPFDQYIFIERKEERCSALKELQRQFPDRRVEVRRGEANEEVQSLCSKDWTGHRAVLFLDPYGMQVDWKTLESVAATCAIDLWLLFPLGIGVNRLVTRSGKIPASWRHRLDTLLGTTGWYDEFYDRRRHQEALFDEGLEARVSKASTETIGRYFNQRLRTIFPGVAAEPGVMRNSTGCPLYLLCFAAANERGAPTALKIAEHLLRELR